MSTLRRCTSVDLNSLPDDGKRYEIISGELYASRPNVLKHQAACGEVLVALKKWNGQTGIGDAVFAPGLIFGEYDDVVPDVVWISRKRLAGGLDENGHLRVAPELIAEVLSPDKDHERRDRVVKLALYSRRGVWEYWILNWQERWIEVFRQRNGQLQFVNRLVESDMLESPLLPGFSCCVASLFEM
jgi:Uma2 family endonuclease